MTRTAEQNVSLLAVLKAIRSHGPVSRSELPALTGLAAGTITKMTADLVERGIVREEKDPTPTRSRPRTLLEIDTKSAAVLGASLQGDDTLLVSLVDLSGRKLFSASPTIPAARGLDELASHIAGALAEVIGRRPAAEPGIVRIGLSIPGVVNARTGVVYEMTTLPSGPSPFAEVVGERTGIPVTIESEGACRARAEYWFGAAQDLKAVTLVNVEFAVTSGEYRNGLPKTGANGVAPEIGHMKTAVGDERPCYCGGHGCLTAFSSIYGILDRAGEIADLPFPPVAQMPSLFERFMDRVDAGDPKATAIIDSAADHLAHALANHVNAADPGTIVLTFSNARYACRVEDRVREGLVRKAMSGLAERTKLIVAVSDENWRWQGTAALALEQTYLGERPLSAGHGERMGV